LLPSFKCHLVRRIAVQAKKAKKPSQSIRYLLFVDKTLKKISLRKMRERVTKMKRPSRVRSAGTRTRRRKSGYLPLATSPRAIVLGVTGVLIAAALLTARQPSPAIDETAVSVTPQVAAAVADPPVAPVELKTTMPAPRPPAMAAVSKARPIDVRPSAPTAKPLAKSDLPSSTPLAKSDLPSPKPEPPAREETAATAIRTVDHTPEPTTPASTISGCVESNDGSLWLTDTSGADAPKSRSWKSGFFKKRSARVEITDASHTLQLSSYIGQRVAATGTLVDRELRAHSLKRVAGSCN
jgi:hypothetical protein